MHAMSSSQTGQSYLPFQFLVFFLLWYYKNAPNTRKVNAMDMKALSRTHSHKRTGNAKIFISQNKNKTVSCLSTARCGATILQKCEWNKISAFYFDRQTPYTTLYMLTCRTIYGTNLYALVLVFFDINLKKANFQKRGRCSRQEL